MKCQLSSGNCQISHGGRGNVTCEMFIIYLSIYFMFPSRKRRESVPLKAKTSCARTIPASVRLLEIKKGNTCTYIRVYVKRVAFTRRCNVMMHACARRRATEATRSTLDNRQQFPIIKRTGVYSENRFRTDRSEGCATAITSLRVLKRARTHTHRRSGGDN